ncbi:MAG: amino acid ABC transporter substrate-binding protein [Deltaproteobacteria bacterium]|nr:amino acid ABC transporter substrate-binding protein [Deltaproteobacteria bacterium]
MKFLLRILLIIIALPAFFGSHAYGRDLSSPDMARILERGKLVVAVVVTEDYPFFMKTPGGNDTGFDIDMARDIAARLGVGVEFNRKAATYNEVIDIVAHKEADLGISDLTTTLERAKKVSFTIPYLKLNTYILANRRQAIAYRHTSTRGIVNRHGVTIMAERGTSYVQFVKKEFPLATVILHEDFDEGLQEVLKGNAFGLFAGEAYVKTLVRERSEVYLYLETLMIEGLTDRIAIAVPWASVHLLAWLNLYLKTDMAGITIDEILNRYPR